MNGTSPVSSSPPRAPPIMYPAPLGTRWAKETAAAGGIGAFDLPTDPKNIGPWILGECVGKGASGRVKIAKHRITGQLAAVKILPIAPVISSRTSLTAQQAKCDKQRLGIDREITMMKLMNHPNIIRIFDVFEGERELFLVLEYVEGGELFDFLVNRGRLPAAEALAYFKQIVYGLRYAHRFSIIHRDLKPENILIATVSPPLVKIADWGMAAFAPPTLQLETSCGSPHYASPEIVNGQKYQGNATDIWSCGVILFALLTGRLPFDDKNVKTLLSKVKTGKYEMPSWIEPQAKDLLSKMLVVDVNQRITIDKILEHPWFLSSASSPQEQAMEAALAQLAPSPSTLARPVASPSQIDSELFSSLRIIWGRHADPEGESIKRDLCSPVGHGEYAKAFYYLLRQHREETKDVDRSEHDLADEGKKVLLIGHDFLTVASAERTRPRDLTTASHAHAENVLPPSKFVPPPMRRSSMFGNSASASVRDWLSSPIGPRALPGGRPSIELWTARNSIAERARCSGDYDSRDYRPLARRGNTYSHPVHPDRTVSSIQFPGISPDRPVANQRPQSTIGVPATKNSYRANTNRYSVDRMLPPTQVTSQAPDAHQAQLHRRQSVRRRDTITASHGRGSSAQASQPLDGKTPLATAQESTDVSAPKSAAVHAKRRSRAAEKGDKENQAGDDSWSRVSLEEHGPPGVGLGMGREVGRNLGNVVSAIDHGVGQKGRRDKKNRPPTLDFRNLSQGKTSVLGSPIQLSTPVNASSASGRLMTSPVVGEFREWFQNLFIWKNSNTQGSALYSFNNVSQTRADTLKLLQDIGVLVENDPPMPAGDVDISAFRCRINDPAGNGWSGPTQLKPLRFRVEFYLAPTDVDGRNQHGHLSTPGPIGPSTPALPAPSLRSRHSILLNRRSLTSQPNSPNPSEHVEFPIGAECAILMVYEKGSMSTYKTVWKRLEGVYGVGSEALSGYSPIMTTPVSEYPQRIPV